MGANISVCTLGDESFLCEKLCRQSGIYACKTALSAPSTQVNVQIVISCVLNKAASVFVGTFLKKVDTTAFLSDKMFHRNIFTVRNLKKRSTVGVEVLAFPTLLFPSWCPRQMDQSLAVSLQAQPFCQKLNGAKLAG